MKKVMLFLSLLISTNLISQNVVGDWYGALEIQGMQIRLVYHITEEDEKLNSTMDSPDQGAFGIPMTTTTFENGELKIETDMPSLKAIYLAKFSEDKSMLDGTFTQNGMSFPLKLSQKEMEKKEIIRPQEPKDFSYVQEEVKFQNPKGEHFLAGTLTKPQDGNFEKVVVLITGSGPQDRNEELLNHKPFLVLSDYLTRHGIAVLRYDDRGVGESKGKFKGATSLDFSEDVASAVAFLKNRKDMVGKKIGLVGHSEGGMIAPMVASKNTDVDFIVLLAGPGIPIPELMLLQSDKITEAAGESAEKRAVNKQISRKLYDLMIEETSLGKEDLKKKMEEIVKESYEKLTDEMKKEMGSIEAIFPENAKDVLLDDWFLYFMRFDPVDFLGKVKCPVLAVNGETDLQVTPKENLEGIRTILEKAGNKNVTIKEFEKLNHLFQKSESGAPSEYAVLEETFNEEAMEFVMKWIVKL